MTRKPSVSAHFLEKVRTAILFRDMIHQGEKVVVGFSGGPDSTALLYALKTLAPELGFDSVAAHLDHGLRAESVEEAQFAETTATNLGVPIRIAARDVNSLAATWGVSVEEAGRRARRDFLEEARIVCGADRIALAHHADDQVETFFLRVFRGSSLTGLGGMSPVFGRVIRPLLTATKDEILAFLDESGVAHRLDPTNLQSDAERNFIRNRLIPLVKEKFSGFGGPLLRTMELARYENAFLDELTEAALKDAIIPDEKSVVLSIPSLKSLRPVLRRRVIREAVYLSSGPYVRLGRVHVEAVESLVMGEKGRAQTHLPGGAIARRVHDELTIGLP